MQEAIGEPIKRKIADEAINGAVYLSAHVIYSVAKDSKVVHKVGETLCSVCGSVFKALTPAIDKVFGKPDPEPFKPTGYQ